MKRRYWGERFIGFTAGLLVSFCALLTGDLVYVGNAGGAAIFAAMTVAMIGIMWIPAEDKP